MNIFDLSCNSISEVLSLNEEQKRILQTHFKFLSDSVGIHAKTQVMKSSSLIEDEETKMFLEKVSDDVHRSISNIGFDGEFIEKLSSIEHEQWMTWAKSIYQEVSDERKKRWDSYFVPYEQLEEPVKAHDRIWAEKVLLISSAKDFMIVEKTQSSAIENLKSCLDNFDQGQFDPDLIDVFKNQVINQFVDNMVEDSHDRNN